MGSVDGSVIQHLVAPTLNQLQLTDLPANPYASGTYTFTRPNLLTAVDAFGFAWSLQTVPDKLSRKDGFLLRYTDVLAQIIVAHQLHDGTAIVTQEVDVHVDGGAFTFDEPLPAYVGVWIFPGCTFNFFWLTVP
jgi:hypothetical protein